MKPFEDYDSDLGGEMTEVGAQGSIVQLKEQSYEAFMSQGNQSRMTHMGHHSRAESEAGQDSRQGSLNGIYNIGAIIGALGCSRILPYGRRYTLLVTSGIYLAAASIT